MNIAKYFQDSVNKYADATALVVDDKKFTYREVSEKVKHLTDILAQTEDQNIGIFASRSLSNFTGILATLACGKTYVALNVKFPAKRNLLIAKMAGLKTLIIDERVFKQVKEIAEELPDDTVLICPETPHSDIPETLKKRFEVYDQNFIAENAPKANTLAIAEAADQPAYISFTSGSTGVPKGVPVSHANVTSLIDYLIAQHEVGPKDRFSQFSDLTFDLSVQDIFLSWAVGASLYIVPERVLFAPAKFIKAHKLTVWFSAPSVIHLLKRFKMLKEGVFPDLRYSFFCGEALSKTLAAAWQEAAPNAIVENIYGPAETTVGISRYRLPTDPQQILAHHGIVSIGTVFETQNFRLINEQDEEVQDQGELCLAGAQVFKGYWQNPEKTAERLIKFEDDPRKWYKTGDIVKREGKNLFFISRKDFMVKIRGNYVELEEINLLIQKLTNSEKVVTLPHSFKDGVATDLYSFMLEDNSRYNKTDILKRLKEELPIFMIPKDVIFVEKFPLNPNGKIHRKQLIKKLK